MTIPDDYEQLAELQQARRGGKKKQRGNGAAAVPPSEDELAIRFTARHGHDWRYVALWGCWMQWDGTLWLKEKTLRAFDLARAIIRETPNAGGKAKTVAAIEQLARSDRQHAMTHEAWDRDTEWFSTPGESRNGD